MGCIGFKRLFLALPLVVAILFLGSPAIYAHTYYNSHITSEQAAQADAVAKDIADYVMSKDYKTDLEKVQEAERIVRLYIDKCVYGVDENKYYRTPYGVFISGNATCAGATRALGRVLEFMGYEWEHVNENEWLHQWCVLTMDGKIGHADAGIESVGYGVHVEGERSVREALERKKVNKQ